MIYTEEDLKQAYAMGYNVAVDDVNAYIELCNEEYVDESMDFSLDESYDNNDDDSAVEAAIMNETKDLNKHKHNLAIKKEADRHAEKHGVETDKGLVLKGLSDQEVRHATAINAAMGKGIKDYKQNKALNRNRTADGGIRINLHPKV